jgi:hypothetical protein
MACLLGILALFTVFRMVRIEGWDDAFYVAQLTSVAGDGDLLLQDDLLALANPFPERLRAISYTTEDGALVNSFSLGPAVLHSLYAWPIVARTSELSGAFRVAITLGSMAMLVLAVMATARLAMEFGPSRWTGLLGAVLAVLWGPLAIYGTRSYLNSHLPSAFCASLSLLAAVAWLRAGALRHALALGLAAGLLVLVRWQDALLAVALAPALLTAWRADGGPPARSRWLGLLAMSMAFLAVAALQPLAWNVQFGSPLLVPQGTGYMNWTRPALASFLLSPYHGLLPWAPGFALGLAGLALAWRAPEGWRRGLARGLLLAVPLVLYVSAAPRDWWGGDSYGPRRLASLTPLAGLGLSLVLHRLRPAARFALVATLSLWAVVVTSAFLSRYDDLAVFFLGRPAADNPVGAAPYAGLHFLDAWGPLHALKPGFTFKDTPRNADRVAGLLAVAAVVGLALALWQAMQRRRVQRLVVTVAIVVLAVRAMEAGETEQARLHLAASGQGFFPLPTEQELSAYAAARRGAR